MKFLVVITLGRIWIGDFSKRRSRSHFQINWQMFCWFHPSRRNTTIWS